MSGGFAESPCVNSAVVLANRGKLPETAERIRSCFRLATGPAVWAHLLSISPALLPDVRIGRPARRGTVLPVRHLLRGGRMTD